MSKQQRALALTLAVAACAGQARAQEVEDPVLARLVAEALERNPELAVRREQVAVARARPEQARARPDPMFGVLYTNDGWSPSLGTEPMTTLGFMLSQPLPLGGKRRDRGEQLAREADIVEQQLERSRLTVAGAVERAYYRLLLSRERLLLVGEQEELWKRIEGVTRARYAVGQGAQPDVLRMQIELTRVQKLRAEQQAEQAVAVAEINQLTGRPHGSPVETEARLALRPVAWDVATALAELEPRSPELRAAALGADRARILLSLAEREYKPDFALQAGYMNRGGLDAMWQAGVSVSLPLSRKRLASGRAEAEAGTRAAAGSADAVRASLRFRTEERLARLEATEEIARLYERGIVPQGRMAVDAALANYQSGKVPFVAVLEALTTLYEDRAEHLSQLAAHAQLRASLLEASLDGPEQPASPARGSESGGMR
jgi:outer membrane protein TolC